MMKTTLSVTKLHLIQTPKTKLHDSPWTDGRVTARCSGRT